jgi:hypothetical protein
MYGDRVVLSGENESKSTQHFVNSQVTTFKKLWPDLSFKAGMRIDAVKINRSSVYYLINTVAPINHELKAEFDAIGSVIIVGLLLGIVFFMRFALVWVQ